MKFVGYFQVRYVLQWERHEYSIRSGGSGRIQAGSVSPNNYYTGVVPDLLGASFSGNFAQVNGYNIRQIEDALYEQQTWEHWRDNIIFLYNNNTENNVNALFSYWN